jgi:hypothetical protein
MATRTPCRTCGTVHAKRLGCPDPRQVGGRYHCFYWNDDYTVLKVEHDHCFTGSTCWTVEWQSARPGLPGMPHVTHHSTAWTWGRDRVLAPRHDCPSLGGSHSADCQLALSRNSATFLPGDDKLS